MTINGSNYPAPTASQKALYALAAFDRAFPLLEVGTVPTGARTSVSDWLAGFFELDPKQFPSLARAAAVVKEQRAEQVEWLYARQAEAKVEVETFTEDVLAGLGI